MERLNTVKMRSLKTTIRKKNKQSIFVIFITRNLYFSSLIFGGDIYIQGESPVVCKFEY